ncbi:MAG: hypothetical protein WB992_00380 [Bryobacteraceae bacterium]
MYAAKRTKLRTRSVTAKVSTEEESLLKQRAKAEGVTLSEWSRQVLLEAVCGSQEIRLLLSELLALRMIVLRLHLDLIEGDQPTKERVKEILERADATKHALAEQRIQSVRLQTAFTTNADTTAEAV